MRAFPSFPTKWQNPRNTFLSVNTCNSWNSLAHRMVQVTASTSPSVGSEVQSVASPRGGEGQSIRRSRNFLPSIFFSVNKTFIKTSFSLLYYPVILKLTICVNMLTIIKKIIDLFIVLQSPPYIICPQHKGQYPNWW